jgi:glutathione S-transferase
MFGAKVEIAIFEKGLDCAIEMVPFSMKTLYEPKHPEVLRVNPKRQVPVLIDGDLELFDSTQIFEYLEDRYPEPPLWPRDIATRARARQWELKSDEVFFPHVIRLMPLRGDTSRPEWQPAKDGIEAYYRGSDAVLATRDWFAGPYTYADIAFYMAQMFAARLGVPMPSDLPNLARWLARITARPAVQRATETRLAFLRHATDRPR